MGLTETGQWADSTLTETGERVFDPITATGLLVFGLAGAGTNYAFTDIGLSGSLADLQNDLGSLAVIQVSGGDQPSSSDNSVWMKSNP